MRISCLSKGDNVFSVCVCVSICLKVAFDDIAVSPQVFGFETKMEGRMALKSASSQEVLPRDSSSPLLLDAQKVSHLQASPLTPAAEVAAVPPPPPPPPLPPPPPTPPHLPATPFGARDAQRRSMKKLNWDTIPSHYVVGKLNVWTSQRPQRDLVLDVRAMEELFSHTDSRASMHTSRGSVRRRDSVDLSAQEPQVTNDVQVKGSSFLHAACLQTAKIREVAHREELMLLKVLARPAHQ